jgi:hypothetical protein
MEAGKITPAHPAVKGKEVPAAQKTTFPFERAYKIASLI